MVIGVDNLHRIRQLYQITDPTLTVYEVDRDQSFPGMSDERILSYCYELKEYGPCIYSLLSPDVIELSERVTGTNAVTGIAFVALAQSDLGLIDEVTMAEHADLFAEWTEPGVQCKRGTILRDDGKLYQALHDINDVAQAAHRPSETPTLWALKGDPSEEWPAWSQWMGVGDLYMTGDKCSSVDYSTPGDETIYHWISTADNNVWRPGEHGWEQQTT